MRVVSLLPAATEWMYEIGLGDALVGRSHVCQYPSPATLIPVVSRLSASLGSDSAAIDMAVRTHVEAGQSLYEVDTELLDSLDPELIITQNLCPVCAFPTEAADRLKAPGRLFDFSPRTFKEVLDTVLRLGRALGAIQPAMAAISKHERRLAEVQKRLGIAREMDRSGLPGVVCLEWLDPLMAAGHWTPDVIEHAGGRPLLTKAGDHSPTISMDVLEAADPDFIAIAPCGFSLDQAQQAYDQVLATHARWKGLRAVREGRVRVFDGSQYFNAPSPRLYDAVLLLAETLVGAGGPILGET